MSAPASPSPAHPAPRPAVFGLIAWCVLALGTLGASAAKPSLTLVLEPEEIASGGFSLLSIRVEDGKPDAATPPTLPAGVELASPLPSTSEEAVLRGGVVASATVYTWQITSEQPGPHVIPAQEIHVNGIPYKSNPTRLVVKEDEDGDASQLDPLLTMEAAKREIYVGEVIPVTVNLYIHRSTFLRRIGLIELPKDNFAIQRFPTQASESVLEIGNVPYRAYAFRSTLSALKPGKFKLGPATTEVILDVPLTTDRFLHPFLSHTEPRKIKPSCNEIEVHVLPLPDQGRPANFKGVVGDFEIALTADPKEIAVGDPISVEMTITGNGNFDALTVPELIDGKDWKLYPAKRYTTSSNAPRSMEEEALPQQAGFTQVIIPRKVVEEIPAFEFSYFSPTQKKYLTLRTPAVPLLVKAAAPGAVEGGAPGSATGTTPAAAAAPPAAPEKVPAVKPVVTDILTQMPAGTHWLAVRPALWQNRNFVLVNVAALGALVCLILSKVSFNAWQTWRLSPEAPARAVWHDLQAPGISRARLYELAAGYIQMKQLKGEALAPIMQKHDTLSFSPSEAATQEPATEEERAAVLKTLKTTRPA